MVLNLLDNAARHTPPGSTVELRLRAEGGDAVVEVADDGPGHPARAARADLRPLRPRRRARPTPPPAPGSGLGLAIVRAVAASHGGSAEVGRVRAAAGRCSGSGSRCSKSEQGISAAL